MLFVCTWLWGTKWSEIYADRLFAGIKRNLALEYRSVLITDRAFSCGADIISPIKDADRPLLEIPGCLARMRMFDVAWQEEIGARQGDRIVCIDIDAVITGALDPLFDRAAEFTIMQGFNQTNPCPFNGSLWMFRAGERRDVWTDFGIGAHEKYGVPIHSIADDQGWLHFKFPKAEAYTPAEGVYAFKKIGWGEAGRRGLPRNARFVAFPGRDPGKYPELGWLKRHWVGSADNA